MTFEKFTVLEGHDDKSSSSQLNVDNSPLGRSRNKRIIILVVLAIIVLAFGLGLGLVLVGLTVNQEENESPLGQSDWLEKQCIAKDLYSDCGSSVPLVVVSLGGFRADYVQRNKTPALSKLIQCGVHALHMRPVYPTVTYPNHQSIATGLYPESHGIVDNVMYDPAIDEIFTVDGESKRRSDWWRGEPIWATAAKQGKITASLFWPGSDVEIAGRRPNMVSAKNITSMSFEERVDTVIEWLALPAKERPHLITVYFEEPDATGHAVGLFDKRMDAMLIRMDSVIHRLMNGIYNRQLHGCVNIMILSDHGMDETTCDRMITLHRNIKIKEVLIFDGIIARIHAGYKRVGRGNYKHVESRNDDVSVADLVKNLTCQDPQLNIYTKSTMPVRHHYTNNVRIGDVVGKVNTRWFVSDDTKYDYCRPGDHGYDNIYESMQAFFVAHGPALKQNLKTQPFENIELYNLMAELIGVVPAQNNGTAGTLSHFLRQPSEQSDDSMPTTYRKCNAAGGRGGLTSGCNCNLTIDDFPFSDRGSTDFPFGEPVLEVQDDVCFLFQNGHTNAYSYLFEQPVWRSFIVSRNELMTVDVLSDCVAADDRVARDRQPDCNDIQHVGHTITLTRVINGGTRQDWSSLTLATDITTMLTGFKTGIWAYVLSLVNELARQSNISLTIGALFDYKADRLWEGIQNSTLYADIGRHIAMPTHFFVLLARCKSNTVGLVMCSPIDIDVMSFILPHTSQIPNCMSEIQYLQDNIARIRDIELMSGFRFMTKFPKSVAARIRTFLPSKLWSSDKLRHWHDVPCDKEEYQQSCPPGNAPLLLVSLDGFRADYMERKLTPVIQKMRTCGVHTPYMRSVYPTVTFPNHYTIVTGLYPESTGIVANTMYDEDIGGTFRLSSPIKSNPAWWGGEPLWITAKKNGLKSATFFWPGSDVNISGVYSDIWKMYSGAVGYMNRTQTVLDWLLLPEDQRPDFLTLYFDEPDHAGHGSGPQSGQVNGQLETVDMLMGRLMDGLYASGMHNCVNIIILADHGMSNISCDRAVVLSRYFNISKALVFDGTFGRILTKYHTQRRVIHRNEDRAVPVDEIVKDLECRHPEMKVFTKETFPKRHHYLKNKRIGEIVLDMKDTWLVSDDENVFCRLKGNHGWDSTYNSMHALFLAHGPAFKKQLKVEPFENIELYNLMAELLNIEPAPNNGTAGALKHLLVSPLALKNLTLHNYPTCNGTSGGANVTACGCSPGTNVSLTVGAEMSSMFPFGVPQVLNGDTVCILRQPGMVTGYSHLLRMPVWFSSILTASQMRARNMSSDEPLCIVADTRVGSMESFSVCEHNYAVDNMTTGLLYDPGLCPHNASVHALSSVVPMLKGFAEGIWHKLWSSVHYYATRFGSLSVMTGPIFDHSGDGLWEGITNHTRFADLNHTVAVPTHFYMIIVKCVNANVPLPCSGNVDVLSYILPHVIRIPNCLSPTTYLKDNIARVVDIELLTGISFLRQPFSALETARLRTSLPLSDMHGWE